MHSALFQNVPPASRGLIHAISRFLQSYSNFRRIPLFCSLSSLLLLLFLLSLSVVVSHSFFFSTLSPFFLALSLSLLHFVLSPPLFFCCLVKNASSFRRKTNCRRHSATAFAVNIQQVLTGREIGAVLQCRRFCRAEERCRGAHGNDFAVGGSLRALDRMGKTLSGKLVRARIALAWLLGATARATLNC